MYASARFVSQFVPARSASQFVPARFVLFCYCFVVVVLLLCCCFAAVLLLFWYWFAAVVLLFCCCFAVVFAAVLLLCCCCVALDTWLCSPLLRAWICSDSPQYIYVSPISIGVVRPVNMFTRRVPRKKSCVCQCHKRSSDTSQDLAKQDRSQQRAI